VAAGECSPPARRPTAGSGAVAGGDPSVLNGVYRYYLDKDALIRAGVEAGRARLEYGVQTITLRDGQFSATWRSADHRDRCDGSYTVAGARGQLSAPSCGLDFRFRWRKTDDGIRFTDIEIVPPRDTPEERVLQRVIWSGKPWKRIADLPSSRSASIPDGAYRKLVDRAELIRGGLNDEQIADEAGVQTILISKGRYTATTTSGAPACGGRVVGSGQRVTFVQDPGKCGPGRAELLSARWALVDGGLRFTDIETNVLPARVVFGGAPWKKIG
jgi:hypothetical protein